MPETCYEIAVVHGDGIGPEVCQAAIDILTVAFGDDCPLRFEAFEGGAKTFLEQGTALPEETLDGIRTAHATLHGAIGDPSVQHPDGTEAGQDFSLNLRFQLDVWANIRHVRSYPGVTGAAREPVDYVIVRENVEGLYTARGGGVVLRDEVASDQLIITRRGTERIARKAFELTRTRQGSPRDKVSRVTVCDKASVLRSYAFFRRICTEVAADYPDIALEYGIVDALCAKQVTSPGHFDVIVSENMFGDIISDLGPATVGGVGLSPTAEIGDHIGYFQAAHGSAPDIAGQGIANPLGTILSAAMMLDWLAERHDHPALGETAVRIRGAVEEGLSDGSLLTRDLGGQGTTRRCRRKPARAYRAPDRGNDPACSGGAG